MGKWHLAGLMALAAVSLPATAQTAMAGEAQAGGAGRQQRAAAAIRGGHDTNATWLAADFRELQVRKRADKKTRDIDITLTVPGDHVRIVLSPTALRVSRGGRWQTIDSAESLLAVQHLLGGSAAIFGARAMLSELEGVSELSASDMALLSTAAFVASIVGDVEAPQRLTDRFVAKHRGLYRQARLPTEGCWRNYSAETTAAWDELQACMADAGERSFVRAAYERLACNAIWMLRAESAWFEYINCLSPIGSLKQ